MKYFIYLVSIIVLIGINLGLFSNLQIDRQIPNLLFLLVMCFSLEKNDYDFFFISLVSGLFLDFYSTGFFGAFTLAFLVISLAAHVFATSLVFMEVNWKTLSLILIFSLFFLNSIVWLYGVLAFKFNWVAQSVGFKTLLDQFLPSLFYNWLLLYPVYLFANFLKRTVDNLKVRSRGVVR